MLYSNNLARCIFLLISIMMSAPAMAQNIVPNPSFEDNANCPSGLDNIGSFGTASDLDNWYNPTDGNPDYYNACVTSSTTAGIPANFYGLQATITGDGYAGFLAYDETNGSRDYLSVELSEPMVLGNTYCIEFSVSLAEFTYVAVEEIAMLLSNNPLNVTNGGIHLGFVPQVVNTSGPITDKTQWTNISTTFVATDNYQYITIGNFNSNSNTNAVDLSVPGIDGPQVTQSYYYLEDVSIIEMPEITVDITPSVVVCEGGEVSLTATGGDSYSWASLSDPFTELGDQATLTTTVSGAESFIVTVNNGICVRRDTFAIPVEPLPVIDFEYAVPCAGFNTIFTDNSTDVFSGAVYQWDFNSDGNVDATAVGTATYNYPAAGSYTATLTILNAAGTCQSTGTIQVEIFDDCDPCTEQQIVTNLVPNPNLENFDVCPEDLNSVESATPWYNPTSASSDYYNTCASDSTGVPQNFVGNQDALSGDGYLGFFAYGNNYREYVSAQLLDQLEVGESYCISFNVSLADSTGQAIDNLGLHFSTDSIGVSTQFPLSLTPQVNNTAGNIITDEMGWTNIAGVYTATDAMDWVTIGNFNEDFNTMVMSTPGGPANLDIFAYYYLDNISISPLPALNLNIVEQDACIDEEIDLMVDDNYCDYAWVNANAVSDTLSTDPTLTVTSASAGMEQYIVYASFGDCTVSDTVTINYQAYPTPNFEVLANCAGAATAFFDNSTNVEAGATYAWDFNNDGTVNSTLSTGTAAYIYPAPGTYTAELVVTNPAGCADAITVEVVIAEACDDPCDAENNVVENPGYELGDCPTTLGGIDDATGWSSLAGSGAGDCPSFSNACITLSALPLITNADGSVTHQYTLTNDCGQKLEYIAFELPSLTFTNLGAGSTYNGVPALGFNYQVNYPTAAPDIPFFAIQYTEVLGDGPNGGDTEFFEYTTAVGETPLSNVGVVVQLASNNYLVNIDIGDDSCSPINPISGSPIVSGTPADWFNSCAGDGAVGIPTNIYGTQLPHGGAAYAGITAYSNDGADQQFLVGNLGTALVPGETYCAKMFVNLADSSQLAIDQLGIYFSVGIPNANDISQSPQANNPANEFLLDQEAWMEIGNTFVADSAYQYIAIGNFNDYTTSSLILGSQTDGVAYYYIDDVSVVPVSVTAPADEEICEGETIELMASTNTCDYYWIDENDPNTILSADTLLTANPSTTTNYVFVGNNGTCSLTDTVTVTVNPLPVVDAGADEVVCIGSSVSLTAIGGDVYAWSPDDGTLDDASSATPVVTPIAVGTVNYVVTVTNQATGCSAIDSVRVIANALPVASTVADTLYTCLGDSVSLGASGGVQYQWEPAGQLSDPTLPDPLATTTDETTFSVTVTNAAGCTNTASLVLAAQSAYVAETVDVIVCAGDSAVLNVPIPPAATSYSWSPDINLSASDVAAPTTYTTTDATYTLTYTDDTGCSGEIEVNVSINPIPNAGTDIQICEGGTAQLNASGGGATYAWSPAGDLSDANIRNPIATPAATTTYVVTVTYLGGGDACQQTDSVTVFVSPGGIVEAGEGATICAGEDVQLNAVGGDTFVWAADPSLSDVNISNPVASPTVTTTYYVESTNGSTGCVATDSVTVVVNISAPPTVATITGDTVFCSNAFEIIEVCLDLVYDGCEELIVDVATQQGSSFEYNAADACFTYQAAFADLQSDTLLLSLCTQGTQLCDELELIIVDCDDPPVWQADTLITSSCLGVSTSVDDDLPLILDPDLGDLLSLDFSQAINGSVAFINSEITYTPNAGFIGIDYFDVYTCDYLYPIQCDTLTVAMSVGINTNPDANNASETTPFNTPADICITYTDAENQDVTSSITSGLNNGTVLFTSGECLTYTPNAGFVGSETFMVQVCDECGLCDDVNVTVNVESAGNTPPVVQDIAETIPFETPVTTCPNIIENDPGDVVVLTITSSVPNGTATIDGNNCVVFTPDAGFTGVTSFTVEGCDLQGECDEATVTITVIEPINNPPIVADTTVTTAFETSILICPETIEPDDNPVTVGVSNPPLNGIANVSTLNPECFIFNPGIGFTGTEDFEILVCDNFAACTNATISVIVLPEPNEAPIASDTTINILPGTASVNICLDILEPEGDVFAIDTLQGPSFGTYTPVNASCFDYNVGPLFNGSDVIEIEICDIFNNCTEVTVFINELPDNTPPTANDTTLTTFQETPVNWCLEVIEPDGDVVTTFLVTPANDGSTDITGTCITYTPFTDFNGIDSLQLAVCDLPNQCDTVWAVINVIPDCDNELVVVCTDIGIPVDVCVDYCGLDNAIIDGGVSVVQNGSITTTDNTCFTYTPNPGFAGIDSVQLVAFDNIVNATDTALAIINVGCGIPIAFDDVSIIEAGFDVTIEILDNDINPCGDDLAVSIVEQPAHGTGSVNNQDVIYDPEEGYFGLDTIVYSICNECLSGTFCDTAYVFIQVSAEVPPQVEDMVLTTPYETAIDSCLTIVEPEGQDYTVTITTNATNGTAVLDGANNDCYTYTPDADFSGTDSFEVEVCDTDGNCVTATVTIIVQPDDSNQPPSIGDITGATPFETDTEPICLSINDPDHANADLVVSIQTNPSNGTVTFVNDTCVIYSPDAGFTGIDDFVVEVCDPDGACDTGLITITVTDDTNTPPTINDIATTTTFETATDELCLSIDDVEDDFADLTITVITAPLNGSGTFTSDSCIVYTPNPGFIGVDQIEVEVCDTNGECAVGTITITVEAAVNEPPTVGNETLTTPINTTLEDICPEISDPDNTLGELIFNVISGPSNGTVDITGNCFDYTPNLGYNGADIITVEVCDPSGACDTGIISINVLGDNSAPTVTPTDPIVIAPGTSEEVCITATEPDGENITYNILTVSPNGLGTATIDGECVTFDAAADEVGSVTITVEVCDDFVDGPNCATTEIVFILNSPPVAEDQTLTTSQVSAVNGCLEVTEPDGNDYDVSVVGDADNGTFSIGDNDCFTYSPNPDFTGTETIIISICDDPYDACTEVTITIMVLDDFIAINDTASTEDGLPVIINVVNNDNFPNFDDLSVSFPSTANNGTVSYNDDGTFTYTPDVGFVGEDNFTYEICDPILGCEEAVVVITVVNELDANNDEQIATFENTPIDIDLLGNDDFNCGDDLEITIINVGLVNGAVSQIGTSGGIFTYLPYEDFVGIDTFSYIISCPGSGSDSAAVIIGVLDLPSAPTAIDDTISTTQNESVVVDVLANDTDPNTGELVVVDILNEPANGTVVIDLDGTLSYVPDTDFTGNDVFTYIACNPDFGDGQSVCDTATVMINVAPLANCEILVFEALSPNGDGKNDYLEAEGLDCEDNDQNEFVVYNRYGNIVYEASNYGTGDWWDGVCKDTGNLVPDGTYYYILKIPSKDFDQQGFIEVQQ